MSVSKSVAPKKPVKVVSVVVALLAAVVALCGWYLHRHTVSVLQPAGEIGSKERGLMVFCVIISAAIVVPVFTLLAAFAWRYRESNAAHATYAPELHGSNKLEAVWWLIPTAIIVIISVVTWRSSYALDPFKQISGTNGQKVLHVQVVALDWKWLFIYPDEHIARVGVVDIPVGTPVEFDITSDTVMSSFWAPQLGGQMYAMPGMSTALNLRADKAGDYHGSAANISGKGFADMTFTVHALPPTVYSDWVHVMHRLPQRLNAAAYTKLAQPGVITQPNSEAKYGYSSVEPGLYDTIITKYMTPTEGNVAAAGAQF